MSNPFADLPAFMSVGAMQAYVILMIVLVVAGTIFDVIHKKSAKYFFEAAEKGKEARTREVGGGEKVSIAIKTLANEVLTSGEFDNGQRRLAHLLTMWGLVLFLLATIVLLFGLGAGAFWPFVWHLGALMAAAGGYWFWFKIRVDVSAEGNPWYRITRADLFVLSLVATVTFALLWSIFQGAGGLGTLFFILFLVAGLVLFGGVPWSKFAHMFYKPAAAYQRHVKEADGSRQNLPPPADKPAQFGLGIKREAPRHY